MSGIFGVYHPEGQSVEPKKLESMLEVLAHRGADRADIWHQNNVGLGHRMLWTTPESLLEKLPWRDRNTDTVITADARIDNREELISLLEITTPADKITDSALILKSYYKWGVDCPQKLLGDFAFTIWDARQQQLFCARDHFGVKPFYYYYSDSLFAFASEIKGIFSLPEVPQELNETRIGDYLESIFYDLENTSYKGIYRLPPANSMIVSDKGIHLESYWNLNPSYELNLDSDEEYAAKFREIFTEAVRCRLRSIYPIGSTLSGGLDSSSISCTARNLLVNKNRTLHTFSAIFENLAECDERKYIDSIVEQDGFTPHFISGDSISSLNELERAFWHQDEALYAPNWFMPWALYGRAQTENVRVMLSGFDGDTVVSEGFGYLSELAKAGRWLELSRQTKELAITFNGSYRRWLWSYIKKYGIKPIINRFLIFKELKRVIRFLGSLSRRLRQFVPRQTSSNKIVSDELALRINLPQRELTNRKTIGNFGQNERERHYLNLNSGMPTFALEVMDKSMAAFAVEPRYPFWDKRLVEFCLALPPEQKLDLGFNRIVMRRAMTGIIPASVQWRRGKTDFSSNLVRGLLAEKQQLDKLIANELNLVKDYINIPNVEKIYHQLITSTGDKSGDARKIWLVISLILWLQYRTKNSIP